jgi:hypothetical protein
VREKWRTICYWYCPSCSFISAWPDLKPYLWRWVPPEDGERIQSLKHCILNKNRTMDNVQKHNNCINISSSQTFRYYKQKIVNHTFLGTLHQYYEQMSHE